MRPAFIATHRLRVRVSGTEADVLVRLDGDRAGCGAAWSAEAWEREAGADFRATLSRWHYVGDTPGVVVLDVSRTRAPSAAARGVYGDRGRK